MRSLPSGWNTVLAMLGFTRKRKSNKTAQRTVHRALRVEALEDRRMLATITVNTHLDVDDSNDGLTTLREAVVAAASSGDTINFAPDLSGAMITLVRVNLGEISFGKSLMIDGSALPNSISIIVKGVCASARRCCEFCENARQICLTGVRLVS